MSPVSLIARKKMVYAGEGYVSGEAFEARDEADASVLTLVGLATRAESSTSDPVPESVQLEPVALAHEPEPEPELAVDGDEPVEDEPEPDEPSAESITDDSALVDVPRRRRGSYRRRDMKAED